MNEPESKTPERADLGGSAKPVGTGEDGAGEVETEGHGSGDTELSDVARRATEAAETLEQLSKSPELLVQVDNELHIRLRKAAGLFARPSKRERKKLDRARRRKAKNDVRDHDTQLLDSAGMRQQRLELVFPTPEPISGPDYAFLDAPCSDQPAADRSDAEPGSANLEHADQSAGNAGVEPGGPRLKRPRTCYVCKSEYHTVHEFYDSLCGECAEFNWAKRIQTCDLSGRVALVTGGRVKIGYHAAIKMLRAGATTLVSTRFPRDAALRFGREKDFSEWKDRLQIYGLDLRHTPSIEAFIQHCLSQYSHLDFILNNACQTVRRPPGFYAHLMEDELRPLEQLPADERALLEQHESLRSAEANTQLVDSSKTAPDAAGISKSALLSQLALVKGDTDVGEALFPSGKLDADLQQVDLRDVNSWRLPLADVPTVELLEVHLVNAVAPFVLNARLKPLMLRTQTRDKHIVNVSAMEGQFYRSFKTDRHPHTNMAKASLNMMTRTSAPDYIRDGIHMNSVDTGWITDEDPAHITERKREEQGFHPPLDHVDAAARICAPIFDGFITGEHVWGQFLKDYRPTYW